MATVTSRGTVVVHRSPVDWVAGALVIIGGLNWGLVGLARFDLVAAIFGADSMGARAVYLLVGVAAIYMLARAFLPARHHDLAHNH